jgi:nucleoside phosphorylase
VILLVAATPGELAEDGLVCGVGPVEAAARTAAALAASRPSAVLHVGVAGARIFAGPELVIGSEAVYCDANDAKWIALRVEPDLRLLEAARRALPEARVEPIGTSARLDGSDGCDVEAMEGYAVLRAAALAGVPALEVRAISNAILEEDRSRWRLDDAKRLLAAAVPKLRAELERAYP